MPEQVIYTPHAFRDAKNQVTNHGRNTWKFVSWVNAGNDRHPIKNFISVFRKDNAISGMRGTITLPNGETKNFTIRHDYDYAEGSAGKGYHVNVELPKGEKYAFSTQNLGEQCYIDCVQMLSQRRKEDGEEAAAGWFMRVD